MLRLMVFGCYVEFVEAALEDNYNSSSSSSCTVTGLYENSFVFNVLSAGYWPMGTQRPKRIT